MPLLVDGDGEMVLDGVASSVAHTELGQHRAVMISLFARCNGKRL